MLVLSESLVSRIGFFSHKSLEVSRMGSMSVASHPDTRMLFLKEAREHYQQNNWVYYMVPALAAQPSSRLLKHIIRCYLQLSDDSRACNALRSCFTDMLRDITFSSCLRVYTIQAIIYLCETDHQPVFAVKSIWISWSKLRSC
ncbi:hypothetical protein POM88_029540 [Heracleum sosnowskyi]|uniref:Uncharacterized protein n=1 Tax=Heracleum sosnowskyi TaxID=360622 RepID=A0AAD8HVR8_9APIA|nr:hypothetical protein POM88_029540 [Heracleum sosnowskyi]